MTGIAVLLPAALLGCAVANAWAAPKTGWDSVSETRFHTAKPVATDDTVNPVRGYHRWQNQELIPQPSPALDAFRRYYWRDLESAEDQYNFQAILTDMATARQQGRKFAFRLRMMAGYDDDVQYGPAYLAGNPNCAYGCGFWADADPLDPGLTWVPDWNDPYLMARSRALLAALAAAIGPTDGIAWIDVGLFGQYGEWALRSRVYASPPPGIYTLRLVARDARTPALPAEARLPLKWVVNERGADGGLTLRTLRRK